MQLHPKKSLEEIYKEIFDDLDPKKFKPTNNNQSPIFTPTFNATQDYKSFLSILASHNQNQKKAAADYYTQSLNQTPKEVDEKVKVEENATPALFTQQDLEQVVFLKNSVAHLHLALRSRLSQEFYIAGGVFSNILHKKINGTDVDFFISCAGKSQLDDATLGVESFCRDMNVEIDHGAAIEDYLNTPTKKIYKIITTKTFLTTLGNAPYASTGIIRWQFILYNNITRKELIEGFDLMHSCVSYDGKKLYISKQALDAINQKLLIKNPSSTKEPTPKRLLKFVYRGYINKTGVSI